MKKFVCALRDDFSSFSYSGCIATVDVEGVKINHFTPALAGHSAYAFALSASKKQLRQYGF